MPAAPMPLLPIDALAIANVVTTINTIVAGAEVTTPAGVFRYGSTLVAKKYSPNGVSLTEGFAHILQGKDKPLAKQGTGKSEFNVPVVIVCAAVGMQQTPGNMHDVEDRLRIMNADIRLALGQDLTRGGWARNTIFDEESLYDLDSKPPLMAVPVTLQIMTARNNRYAK